MKKILSFCLLIAGTVLTVAAQPIIDSTEMPVTGEILNKTEILSPDTIDYVTTGANYTWDFQIIDGTNVVADTFVAVNSTPLTYIAVFNNPLDPEHRATVASPQPPMQSAPGVSIQNMINFYKRTYTYFGQVGFGAEINSLPVPVKFDNADILYRFPMSYGDTSSSTSFYEINIPSVGYHCELKHRVNEVDGWGTLIVPGDTFEVMRISSFVQIYDSIYVDSLGFGMGFDRTETEYKWLSPGYHLPVLYIVERQGGMGPGNPTVDGWFVDNRDHTAIAENGTDQPELLYPNPAKDFIILPGTGMANSIYTIFDATGHQVATGAFTGSDVRIDVSRLPSGTYLIQSISGGVTENRVFLISR